MQPVLTGGVRIGDGGPARIAGVINCSPESFYHGSYFPPSDIYAAACRMADEGADILDLGARSTAPRAPPLPPAAESARLRAALDALDGTGFVISVDTTRPEVLDACQRYSFHAVNDISGLAAPGMAEAVADLGLPAILMASFRVPGDACGLADTLVAARETLERADRAGVREVVLDPGIGIWTAERTTAMDWELCRSFGQFRQFHRPLLAAVSRKTFLGEATGREPAGRLAATIAVTVCLLARGADLIRTHDVAETRDLIAVHSRAGWLE